MVLSSLPGDVRPLLLPGAPVPCGDGVGRAVLAAGVGQWYSRLRAGPEPSCLIAPGPSWSDITRPRRSLSPRGAFEGLRREPLASVLRPLASRDSAAGLWPTQALWLQVNHSCWTRVNPFQALGRNACRAVPLQRAISTGDLRALQAKNRGRSCSTSSKTARGCKQEPLYCIQQPRAS